MQAVGNDLRLGTLSGSDINDYFYIKNGGKVGINISNPRVQLDLQGDLLVRGGDVFVNHDDVADTNNDYLRYQDVAGLGSGGVFSLHTDTVREADWTNANAGFAARGAYFSGNVGIGTTSPNAKMNTYRNDSVTAYSLLVEQAGTGDVAQSFMLTGVRQWTQGVDNSDDDKFKLGTGGSVDNNTLLTVETTGNVGIGTTIPSHDLHVDGHVRMAARTGERSSNNVTTTGWYRLGTVSAAGTSGINSRFRITMLGAAGYGQSNDSLGQTVILGAIQHDFNPGRANVSAHFYSVGGEPVVSEVKFVESGDRFTYEVHAHFSAQYGDFTPLVEASPGITWEGAFVASSDPGVDSATVMAAVNQFSLTAGNVGIGTSIPVNKLHLEGDYFRVVNSNSAEAPGIVLRNPDLTANNAISILFNSRDSSAESDNGAKILAEFTGRTATGISADLVFSTADDSENPTEKVRITSGGNVGIGTTDPSSILDINGAITTRNMSAPALSPAGQGRIYFDSSDNKYKVSQNGSAYSDLVGGSSIKVYSARIASNCSVSAEIGGDWLASTADTGTGRCDLTLQTSPPAFSSAPACTCTGGINSGFAVKCSNLNPSDNTKLEIQTKYGGGSNVDGAFEIICVGP
jgi:hypothetical protein